MIKPYYSEKNITIYHGDCRDILPSIPKVDLVLTDPPYGVGFKYEDSYKDTTTGFVDLIYDAYDKMRPLAPIMFVFTGIRHMWIYPKPDWVLCWSKPGTMGRNGMGGFNAWEPIFMYGKRKLHQDLIHVVPGTALGQAGKETGDHPCPKPLRLFTWLIGQGSDEGTIILDPFMGSGTTLRAAKDLGRKAIGIEIEEKYCEIAVKRLRQEVLPL